MIPRSWSDERLLAEVADAVVQERRTGVRLIALLIEFDARRLYLPAGCSSLFTYCTQVLRLSRHAAYGRIEAARAARQYPVVLEMLEAATLNLTPVGSAAATPDAGESRDVLASAAHRSKREVEEIVARRRPQPAVASTIRELPKPRQTLGVPAPGRAMPGAARSSARTGGARRPAF